MGQNCFVNHFQSTQVLDEIFKNLKKSAFDVKELQAHGKFPRQALNCIANMILMKSEFTLKNIGVIYQQLKRALDTVMKKINMKSKKFIQILQTLLRAV